MRIRIFSHVLLLFVLISILLLFLIISLMPAHRQIEFRPSRPAELQEAGERRSMDKMPEETSAASVPRDEQIVVVVIAAKRPRAIRNHLDQLARIRQSPAQFPVVVSQDGTNAEVATVIAEFAHSVSNMRSIQHSDANGGSKRSPYKSISRHYKWTLDTVFAKMGYKVAIITEDDLDIAEDFFSYFLATKPLLFTDPTVFCVSAWNDNGNPALVDWKEGAEQLWRTDFFPGLGWMLRAELWSELSEKWPGYTCKRYFRNKSAEIYWDDWLRSPEVRKERACVRPEQSRTLHNLSVAGRGSSNGLYKNFLSSIRLPEKRVNFTSLDLSRLRKQEFDAWLGAELKVALEVPIERLLNASDISELARAGNASAIRVRYNNPREFRNLARKFNLMADIRSGMPRTAYCGVVPFFVEGVRVFAVHRNLRLDAVLAAQSVYSREWDLQGKYLDFAELYCTPKRWTGKCDPDDEGMREWFHKKGWKKRLEQWLPLSVF